MASSKSQKLEDQAATAALYVTQGKDKPKSTSTNYPLDKDGKLSSAGAATSLKHAAPRDLPSYPSAGLANQDSASGAAASIASSNQKTFEHWKPGQIPAANRAAFAAKDHKAPELWQPELSAAGSRAALIAQKDGGNVNVWRPEDTDAGYSAAGQAMRKKGLSPQAGDGHTADGERRALLAATGAMSGNRRRAESTPDVAPSFPDAANSSKNALKAANSVSKSSKKPQPVPAASTAPQLDAARIHDQAVTNLSREMYTANPPVAPEVEEKNRQAGLRAAAVSMAKRMYELQQKKIEEAAEFAHSESQYAASSVHNRPASSASSNGSSQPPQYTNLQEAAQKLASERLAKLHDEHAAYRTYYGTQAPPHSRKLSVRGRARRRASSEGELDDDERAQQVRNQMSLFSDKLAQVDNKKRQKDRDLLMAAAQKNVRASMHGMDEKVYNETGKISPAMMEEWEAKAKAKAQAESETRLVNHGKVSIGGGKFLDQSEVDAIAAAKVQPTLDEITETAEKHRARDEELRQQQLERERIAAEKAADDKERAQRTKDEWKRFKEEEKREKQAKKEEEKAKKAEEKRAREEEKKKVKEEKTPAKPSGEIDPAGDSKDPNLDTEQKLSQETPSEAPLSDPTEESLEKSTTEDSNLERFNTAETGDVVASDSIKDTDTQAVNAGDVGDQSAEKVTEPGTKKETPLASRIAVPTVAAAVATTETTVSGPSKSKDKDSGKVSSWLKTKFSRRTSKAIKPDQATPASTSAPAAAGAESDKEKTTTSAATEASGPDSSDRGEDSMREVAIAGKDFAPEADQALTSHPTTTADVPMVATSGPIVSPFSENLNAELYDNDDDAEGTNRRASTTSPEISSLSSDEDTRGRSAIRLADEMNLPTNQAAQQPANKRAGMVVPDIPLELTAPAPATAATETGDAAKTIEKDEEDLPPPPPVPAAAETRVSSSPARDSRFIEAL